MASGAGSGFAGAGAAATVSSPPLALALYGASCALGLTSCGLSLYSIWANHHASEHDQRAGRLLARQGQEACVEGAFPEVPPPPPAASSQRTWPADPPVPMVPRTVDPDEGPTRIPVEE